MNRTWIWRVSWLAAVLLLAFLQPQDPLGIDISRQFEAPSFHAWLGTDRLGRDIYSRTGVAVRTSLINAGTAEVASFIISILVAAAFAFLAARRRWLGEIASVVTLALRTVPPFLLALTAGVLLRETSFGLLVSLLVLSFIYSEPVFESEIRQALRSPQIEGALVLGASRRWILLKYLLPRVMPRFVSYATLDFASLVAYEAVLGFVGLTSPPRPSLGAMIFEARPYILDHPWLFIAPAAALVLLLVGAWSVGHHKPQWR